MRFAILIAAFGIMTGVPALVPALAPAAQALQNNNLPATEQTSVDAAIDAVFADSTLTPAEIQTRITSIVQNASNPVAAARRVAAKVANQPQATQRAAGAGLAQVAANLQASDPLMAGAIQVAVGMSPVADFQIGYVNGPTIAQTGNTQPIVVQQQTLRVMRRITPPPSGSNTISGIIEEPNPAQSGSPT